MQEKENKKKSKIFIVDLDTATSQKIVDLFNELKMTTIESVAQLIYLSALFCISYSKKYNEEIEEIEANFINNFISMIQKFKKD